MSISTQLLTAAQRDMLLDNGRSMTTKLPDSCTNLWDFEGTVTHEWGNSYGLGHTKTTIVPTSSPNDIEDVLHVLVGGRDCFVGRLAVEAGAEVRRIPVSPVVLGRRRLERAVMGFGVA